MMKIKHGWTKICLLAIVAVAASLISTPTVFATYGGTAGTDTSQGPQTSSSCPGNYDWDHCGAGFIRVDVNNPLEKVITDQSAYYNGVRSLYREKASECKKIGASELYVLAHHYLSNWYTTGIFAGFKQVKELKYANQPGGSLYGIVPYIAASGALEFNEANRIHTAAARYATRRIKDHPEDLEKFKKLRDTPWPEISSFCWNPAWEEQEAETTFGAFSIVVSDEINNGARNSTYPTQDSKKTWEITTNEDKVRVTFAHKFFYYGGNKLSTNTTQEASTDWQVRVTRDGKGYYEPDLVVSEFVDPFSNMMGTYSVPGYNKNAAFSGSDGSGCPGNICNEDVGVNTYDIDVSNLGLGESTVVCSEIDYDPKALLWRSENGSPFTIVKRTNANKSSTGCVKITRGVGESLEFWSNSSAEASYGNQTKRQTSQPDDDTNLIINLDEDDNNPVTVKFWHNIHYTGNIPENIDKDVCTTFTFKSDSAIKAPTPSTIVDESNASGNQYCANKHESMSKDSAEDTRGNENDAVGKDSSVIIKDIQPGDKKVVCQTISYDPKYFRILKDEKKNTVTADNGTGRGSSTACVTITKEKGVTPPETELPEETPFYTGEPDDLIFKDIQVESNHRKVLLEAVSYYYRVPVSIDMSSNPAEGINETDLSPQQWFINKSDAKDFTQVERVSDQRNYYLPDDHDPTVSPSDTTTLTLKGKKVDINVPDTVGDKICKGVAYHWEERKVKTERHIHRWSCSRYGCTPIYDNIYSYPDPDELKNYWQIEGSTCEPILKKPTTNIWNGSLSTQAGISTTVANRYSRRGDPGYTIRNILESIGDEKNKFGSWSEYLAVVGGTVSDKPFGFGSGTSLSYKGANPNSELINNSPITIANSDSSNIGKASITPSSTYASRLKTYIYNNSALTNATIIECGDPCEIDRDVVNNYTANSVDETHQIIYHATGDINIHSRVTRIDAWLISDNGIVNTCEQYQDKETQAKVDGYAPSNNADCSSQLTINGPIIAKGIRLNRTAGSDPITYKDTRLLGNGTDPRAIPGEVFNLSADTYLWSYAQASKSTSSYTEAYSRELPPRY